MGSRFAPAGSVVAGSAAETVTESWVAMAAGIVPEIARKVRRERDVPRENELFILTQNRRWWLFLGNAGRILCCHHASQSQAGRAAGCWFLTLGTPRIATCHTFRRSLFVRYPTLRHIFVWSSAQFVAYSC